MHADLKMAVTGCCRAGVDLRIQVWFFNTQIRRHSRDEGRRKRTRRRRNESEMSFARREQQQRVLWGTHTHSFVHVRRAPSATVGVTGLGNSPVTLWWRPESPCTSQCLEEACLGSRSSLPMFASGILCRCAQPCTRASGGERATSGEAGFKGRRSMEGAG